MKINFHYDRALTYATEEAQKAKNLGKLPLSIRTVACIVTGQAMIDNGGLQYFFESDFPNCPSYSYFIDAYRTIGATTAADALEKAVALFPFSDPHKSMERRNEFLDSFKDEDDEEIPGASPFEKYTMALCGNKEVWNCLKQYVAVNEKAFPV